MFFYIVRNSTRIWKCFEFSEKVCEISEIFMFTFGFGCTQPPQKVIYIEYSLLLLSRLVLVPRLKKNIDGKRADLLFEHCWIMKTDVGTTFQARWTNHLWVYLEAENSLNSQNVPAVITHDFYQTISVREENSLLQMAKQKNWRME